MMKVVFGLAMGVALWLPALAQDDFATDRCEMWADFAYMTMRMRQDGVMITTAFEAARATHVAVNSPEEDIELSHMIIAMAYKQPLASTDRLADVAAIQFSEESLRTCLKAAAN